MRRHPVTGEQKMHWGTDFTITKGTAVVAAAGGIVETSKLSSSFGNYVVIRHDNGSATLYAHLHRRLVDRGAAGSPNRVNAGQQVGLSNGEPGNPGRGTSTGAHLHFEYLKSGSIGNSPQRVDPDKCIVASQQVRYRYSGFAFNGAVSGDNVTAGRVSGTIDVPGIHPSFTGTVTQSTITNFEFTDGTGRTDTYTDENTPNPDISLVFSNGQLVDWDIFLARSYNPPFNTIGTFLDHSFLQIERDGRVYDKRYYDIASISYLRNYQIGNILGFDFSHFVGGSDRRGEWTTVP